MTESAGSKDGTGRVVVVTGANGAAGQAVARRLAADGAHVVAAGRRALDWGDDRISPATVDLLDAAATRAWAADVAAQHGRIDGLVHLVGGWRGGTSFEDTDLDDWAFLHDQLVRTLQHTTLAFHPHLRATPRGRFAIVSQHAARHPKQNAAAYATAKAASEAWTLAMADSFADAASGDSAPEGAAPVNAVSGGTGPAAVILVVEALLTDQMRTQQPDADFSKLTHVNELADAIASLWDSPAAQLNGTR